MNIMWRASSIESKKRGDLRGPESGAPGESADDAHRTFRRSERLLGHVLGGAPHSVGASHGAVLRSLRAKRQLLGKLRQRQQREQGKGAGGGATARRPATSPLPAATSPPPPSLGLTPKPKALARLSPAAASASPHHHHHAHSKQAHTHILEYM